MKTETFKTLLALDKAPPIMPAKRKAVAKDEAEAAIMTFKQVSELTGPTIKVLKKRKTRPPSFRLLSFSPVQENGCHGIHPAVAGRIAIFNQILIIHLVEPMVF